MSHCWPKVSRIKDDCPFIIQQTICLQLNKEPIAEEPTTEIEKKSNGVTIDVVPVVIVEIPNEGSMGRKGSLRYRGK